MRQNMGTFLNLSGVNGGSDTDDDIDDERREWDAEAEYAAGYGHCSFNSDPNDRWSDPSEDEDDNEHIYFAINDGQTLRFVRVARHSVESNWMMEQDYSREDFGRETMTYESLLRVGTLSEEQSRSLAPRRRRYPGEALPWPSRRRGVEGRRSRSSSREARYAEMRSRQVERTQGRLLYRLMDTADDSTEQETPRESNETGRDGPS